MADFRRCIPAFIVVLLLLGATTTMNAQAPGSAFICTASAGVPPILRSEGLTELAGDIVVNCTGGTPTAAGLTIAQANITVFVNTQVTSRILNTNNNLTEALLLIDEPTAAGSPVPTANVCGAVTGCTVNATGVGGANPFIAGKNVYRSTLSSNNSITFLGVPVEPPGTTGARIYRITNLRVNASAIQPSGALPGQVTASLSSSGSTSLPISNPSVVIGFTQAGLGFSIRSRADGGAGNGAASAADKTFQQCSDVAGIGNNVSAANKLPNLFMRFTEGFATAWKTQGTATQSIPGTIYNTESGLTGVLANAGLADFGTRLKATFNNIPAGVSIYVPTNLTSNNGTTATLTFSETGPFVPVPNTDTWAKGFYNPLFVAAGATPNAFLTLYQNGMPVAPVALANGAGSAVWEITNSPTTVADSLDAAVFFVYTANPGAGSPAAGTGTVTGSFAPTYDISAAGTPGAAQASAALPIPRFVSLLSSANLMTIAVCRTNLLFPYLASVSGFDTGIAIANTTSDPFGTTAQSGNCTLNFYGTGAPSAKTIGPIAGGATSTLLGSTDFPNFQGYMIAVCNFQFAHGFAFISDLGARNWGTVYLADIIPDVKPRFAGMLTDAASGESLGQ
ncbi:MAG: hypothetical protein M1541_17615 [Acidobacteria bacterium]|nr:hypothetical protein [Acidobacteriota bacterium]